MKSVLLALLFLFAPLAAHAQGCGPSNPLCIVPTAPAGTNNNQAASTAYVQLGIFGTGSPWVDVKSGANGCAAAVGNGSNDDTSAIQCQATFMHNTFNGGTVFLPCGTYHTTSTITVNMDVRLQGAGRTCAVISVGNNDIQVLTFTATGTNNYGGLRDLWIVGDQAGGALTNSAVVVNSNAAVVFENFNIWGGNFGLVTSGIDSSFRDGFVCGTGSSGGCLDSTGGANWYERVKFDTIGVTVQFGLAFGSASALAENHFVNCDVSGSFSSNSVAIADANNNTLNTFTGVVFSSSISVTGARYTIFSADEFGAAVANSNSGESVVGSFGLSALTFTGTGTRNCAGNGNITC